jgi:hypothetical protein
VAPDGGMEGWGGRRARELACDAVGLWLVTEEMDGFESVWRLER